MNTVVEMILNINYWVIRLSERLRFRIAVSPIKGGKTSDQDV